MNSDFAYSHTMFLITMIISFVTDFFSMYFISSIILMLFKTKAFLKKKILFAFWAGTVLYTLYIYIVYFIGGAVSFHPTISMLVITPNPIIAAIYCYLAIKIFDLAPARSIKLISYVYVYWMIMKALNKILKYFFFLQSPSRYNFLLSSLQQIVFLVIIFTISHSIIFLFKHKKLSINLYENEYSSKSKELLFYLIKAMVTYFVCILPEILIADQKMANILVFFILLLFFISLLLFDMISYYKQIIEDNQIHINALFKGNELFSGVKHDFYNILQTYSGFIEIGNLENLRDYHKKLILLTTNAGVSLDLSQRIEQNPPLVSLLMSKVDYAEKLKVKFNVIILCRLEEMYLDNIDLSRMLACLLDNAIEAAATSDQKTVCLTIEAKNERTKVIIISNSTNTFVDVNHILTPGVSNKENHTGIGLTTICKVLNKYENCRFQMKYFNDEFTTFLEMKGI